MFLILYNMESPIIGIISLIASIAALGFSFYTYYVHDSILKRQEKIINDFQVKALEREEAETKKAKIRGNIIEASGKGARELRIFNDGQVTARNVKVEWLNCRDDDGVYASEDFSNLGSLSPHNPWKVRLLLECGHEPKMHLRYTWEDDYQENNMFEEFLQI